MRRNAGNSILLVAVCAILVFVVFLRAGQNNSGAEDAAAMAAVQEPHPPTSGPDEYGAVELSGIMTPEEIAGLDKYEKLQKLDLSGSTCYKEILEYISTHPRVEVTYTVTIGDTAYPADSGTVFLSTAEQVAEFASVAEYFKSVEKLEITCDDFSKDSLVKIKETLSDTLTDYSVMLNGESVSSSADAVDLSSIGSGDVKAVAEKLVLLPNLETIQLMKDDGTTALALEDLAVLLAAAPNACFNYSFELFGKQISTSDTSLEFVDQTEIGNEGLQQLRAVLPYMSRLEYLKLDDCGTDDVSMAALRDDYPDIKVVWRVYFSAYGERMDGTTGVYSCLTDTEKVWATGCVHDQQAESLKYCTDVKYLDLGHNCITKIDFVSYMPKLEVAIFAISWVNDLSPLADCPNLEYLEAFSLGDDNTKEIDISPLAACTNLKHLNLSNIPRSAGNKLSDISPLYDLNLERFFCTMNNVPVEQQEKYQALHPDCECEFRMTDPTKYAWRYTDDWSEDSTDKEGKIAHRTERYALLCEQIGYDTLDYSKK